MLRTAISIGAKSPMRSSIPLRSGRVTRRVLLKNSTFAKNNMILGDGKWSIILYESFIGHPDATIFWTPSRI
jgi:hypothetical protein